MLRQSFFFVNVFNAVILCGVISLVGIYRCAIQMLQKQCDPESLSPMNRTLDLYAEDAQLHCPETLTLYALATSLLSLALEGRQEGEDEEASLDRNDMASRPLQTPPHAPEACACSRSGKISDVKTHQTGPIPIGKNATFPQTKRRANVTCRGGSSNKLGDQLTPLDFFISSLTI